MRAVNSSLILNLFYILQSIKALFTGSDFYNIFHIINENLTVSDMSCIKHFLSRFDNTADRNFAHHDFYLDFRKQVCLNLYAAVILRFSFLYAASKNVRYGHACNSQIHHCRF